MVSTAGSGSEVARHAMVASQLRPSAVNDPRVVAAMAAIPREDFVDVADPPLAYRDRPLPLAEGRMQNAPLATGRLLTEAAIAPGDAVLLIGAATGYTAALLARLAARVVAVESDAVLAGRALANLADLPNVTVIEGDFTAGSPEHAPYDVLIVDGLVERLPDTLVQQLRPGGRAVTGLLDRTVARLATGIRSAGGFGLTAFADVDCVALPGFAAPPAFHFPG